MPKSTCEQFDCDFPQNNVHPQMSFPRVNLTEGFACDIFYLWAKLLNWKFPQNNINAVWL